MKILLIGYMGSGKSAVGQRLAQVLKLPFIDLDTKIEEESAMSVSEIFQQKGEIFFRRKENETLQKLLASNNSFVLATGGGTPCYGSVMEQIKKVTDAKSIFLHTSLQVLTERLFPQKSERPLIAHIANEVMLHDFIRKHIFERNYYYLQADIKVNADKDIESVVSEIVLNLF